MANQYKKSAKDLAFDRERVKLQSQIQKLQEDKLELGKCIKAKDAEISAREQEIAELKQDIQRLTELLNVPAESLQQYLADEREKAKQLREVEGLMQVFSRGFP